MQLLFTIEINSGFFFFGFLFLFSPQLTTASFVHVLKFPVL